MADPTPEEKAPFGFEDTTQLVEWFRTQEISVAVAGLDAVHRNLVRAAVAANTERCAALVEAKSCGGSCDHPIHHKQWQLAAAIRRGESALDITELSFGTRSSYRHRVSVLPP